jgi:hypothetical protein
MMRLAVAALAGCAACAAWTPPAAVAQSYRSLVESRRLDRSEPVEVNVEFGLGRFRLGRADGSQLYRVGLTYLEDHFEPEISFDPEGGSLDVTLSGERHTNLKDLKNSRQRLDLLLSPEVPLQLDLNFGAVEADVELGGLTLTAASLETGASQTTVRFTSPNRAACDDLSVQVGAAEFSMVGLGNSRCRSLDVKGGVAQITLDFSGEWPAGSEMQVDAEVGVGELRFLVPEGVGVQVTVSRFLASLDLEGFTREGSTWLSDGFDRAASRLIVDLSTALGSIRVERIP